jgi:hypothetical protein
MRVLCRRVRASAWFTKSIRAFPGTLAAIIGLAGLLFPDAIKWAQPGAGGNTYAVIIAVLGVLAILVGFIRDAGMLSGGRGVGDKKLLPSYFEALNSTIDLLPLTSKLDENGKASQITNVLRNICYASELQIDDSADHHHAVNVCLYVPISVGAADPNEREWAAKFEDSGRNTYHELLVLKAWAFVEARSGLRGKGGLEESVPCVPVGFALPVDSDKNYTLFGAPHAYHFLKPNGVTDIRDEGKLIRLPGMNDTGIRKQVLAFFGERSSYHSFISIPIKKPNDPKVAVGVVCVQSMRPNFCNLGSDDGVLLLQLISPFVTALGQILVSGGA